MAIQYSIHKMVSDGTLSTIALGIQYLQRNDIYIRIAGKETPQSGAPSGYTWSFIDNTALKILPVVPNGVEVVVYRRTDVDTMYNVYSQNAQFDEATIDENNQQLLYIAQEYLEQGIPGAGVDTIEFLRDDGINTYYRIKRTDGSYSKEFSVPSAGSVTKIVAREALRRSYAEAGYNLVGGSFKVGFTFVNANDVALDEVTGKAFSGVAGTYPAETSTVGFTDRSASSVARLNLGSVQALKARTGLSVGDVVGTGLTCWKIVPSSPFNVLPISGGLAAFPLNGAWLDDWLVDRTGTLPVDAEFAEALSVGRAVMLGQGKYRVNTKKVLPPGATVKGVSEHSIIDARMADALFEFPVETGRNVKVFRDFHVYSTGNEMFPNGCVFKFPGVATGATVRYSSGYKFENIEVGGGGAFGCIWDLSDTFRLTVRDCGYSFVTNPVRIRGSVVQCTIDNLTGNNNSYSASYDGQNAGVWMEPKTYSDGVKVSENAKIMSCGFVTHRIGIRHLGLAINLQNNDLDYIRDVGTKYGGGDGHVIYGGYIAHSGQNFPFIGSLVQKTGTMDDVSIRGVTYSTYSAVSAKQTAVQIGDGDTSPYAQPSGPSVSGIKVLGGTASWDFGVQADRCESVSIDDNFVKNGVIKAGGKAINATYAQSMSCCRNKCYNQEIYITAPNDFATITATDNLAIVSALYMAPPAANVEIARNRRG